MSRASRAGIPPRRRGRKAARGSNPARAWSRGGFARPGSLRPLFLLVGLALLTLVTFWKVLGNDFIFYDDNVYVTGNSMVRQGLTWQGVRWAFTTGDAANWHPLTWLSHMTDVSLSGMDPSGHHATSLVLHVANVLLLFLALRSLTGTLWQSAFVAAIFAVHPAHVESVAWVAERKDLLSAGFGLAAIWAYGSWVRRRSGWRYGLVLIFLAAALMSKPMAVTIPLILLLLDIWPLKRMNLLVENRVAPGAALKRATRLVVEKAPLFGMAAASSLVTFLVQRAGGAVGTFEKYPIGVRVSNALVAYARYLGMFFFPRNLAIFYPHPGASLPTWGIVGAAVLLAGLSVAIIALRRRAPYLLVGWLWFLITLLPVIGLIQVGWQSMADRYTYVPFIGLAIAVGWGVPDVALRWKKGKVAAPIAASAALGALALAAMAQVAYWRNSETLFLHALAVTKDNVPARNNLANYYNETGKPADALPHLAEVMRLRPNSPEAYINLGHSQFLMQRLDEAGRNFSEALRLEPKNAVALNDLARVRFLEGEIADAIRLYAQAVAIAPDALEIRRRLSMALLMDGKTSAALQHARQAAALSPQDEESRWALESIAAMERSPTDPSAERLRAVLAAAHRDAAVALDRRGKTTEAVSHLRRSLDFVPDSVEAHINLGVLLTKDRQFGEAAAEFERALRIDAGSALGHSNLGYTLFLRGMTEAAIREYREALRLQPDLTVAQNNLRRALLEKKTPAEVRKGSSETAQ